MRKYALQKPWESKTKMDPEKLQKTKRHVVSKLYANPRLTVCSGCTCDWCEEQRRSMRDADESALRAYYVNKDGIEKEIPLE